MVSYNFYFGSSWEREEHCCGEVALSSNFPDHAILLDR